MRDLQLFITKSAGLLLQFELMPTHSRDLHKTQEARRGYQSHFSLFSQLYRFAFKGFSYFIKSLDSSNEIKLQCCSYFISLLLSNHVSIGKLKANIE